MILPRGLDEGKAMAAAQTTQRSMGALARDRLKSTFFSLCFLFCKSLGLCTIFLGQQVYTHARHGSRKNAQTIPPPHARTLFDRTQCVQKLPNARCQLHATFSYWLKIKLMPTFASTHGHACMRARGP